MLSGQYSIYGQKLNVTWWHIFSFCCTIVINSWWKATKGYSTKNPTPFIWKCPIYDPHLSGPKVVVVDSFYEKFNTFTYKLDNQIPLLHFLCKPCNYLNISHLLPACDLMCSAFIPSNQDSCTFLCKWPSMQSWIADLSK